MKYLNYIDDDGTMARRTFRNCDRCESFGDARKKFREEEDGDGSQFYRRLSEWLMEAAE